MSLIGKIQIHNYDQQQHALLLPFSANDSIACLTLIDTGAVMLLGVSGNSGLTKLLVEAIFRFRQTMA